MKGIYYIENSINEFGSIITGYFSTIKEAKEAERLRIQKIQEELQEKRDREEYERLKKKFGK